MFWIEHLGIVVRNLEDSIAFYAKLFGNDPVERVTWRGDDAQYIARMLGLEGQPITLDAAFFEIPHTNALLEMLQYAGIPQEPTRSVPTDIGATHFGFYVESLDDTVRRMGAPLSGPPTDIPYGPYKGGRTAYLRDPDGVNLQLMEVRGRPGRLPVLRSGQSLK